MIFNCCGLNQFITQAGVGLLQRRYNGIIHTQTIEHVFSGLLAERIILSCYEENVLHWNV